MSDQDPGSWLPEQSTHLGKPLTRLEDLRFVTGVARFVSDLAGPGVSQAVFVRSMISHGELRGVDLGESQRQPGVNAVLTAGDLDLPDIQPRLRSEGGPRMGRPPLARTRVRYVGEPVAVVIAETREAATDAAEHVWPEIEPLPAVTDPMHAEDGEAMFPEGNVVSRVEVSSELSLAEVDLPVRVEVEVHNQRLAPSPIEGLAILCEPSGTGLEITCSHQTPHRLRDQISSMLGVERVRVVVPDVGGAFGLKGMFFPEYLVVAAAAIRLQRAVMWIERRREHFLSGTHGRGQMHRVELAGDQSGRIRRARIEILADVGAYPHNGGQIPDFTRLVSTGLYDIEQVSVTSTVVVTNRAPTGSYRGAGRPEAAFAIERAVDAFARAAGLDPAAVRAMNFIRREQLPYRTATGALYDSGDYQAALARALEMVDVDSVRSLQRERLRKGQDPIGLGIGAFIERAGGAVDSGEFAEVEIVGSGGISVRTGSTSSGQGHATVWSQAMSEIFGVGPDLVEVISGDTAAVEEGVGTFASRSAQIGASAAWRVGSRVRDMARDLAAEMLEASPGDIVLEGGRFAVSGVPGSEIGLAEVASYAVERDRPLRSHELYVPGAQTFPYGVHVAVVEVSLETGAVRLLRLVAVDDCGNVLNPMIVDGQLHGSLAQGMGQALLEGVEYDSEGQLSTASLLDYKIPAATDVPFFESDRIVSPAPSNPLGVKGTGEAGCIGAPPAIVNGVLDALGPFGVEEVDMPLRPGRVWEALRRIRGA